MRFAALARLLTPADPDTPAVVVEAAGWELPEVDPATGVVVWGRDPLPPGTHPSAAWRHRRARRRAAAALRHRIRRWHRLDPADVGSTGLRQRLRVALLAGAAVELAAAPYRRVLDEVLDAAGATDAAETTPRVGSGGGVVVPAARVVVRIGPGAASQHAVLERLAAVGFRHAPQPGRSGTVLAGDAPLGWACEERVRGPRPARLSRSLAAELAVGWAQLPTSGGPPTAHRDDLAAVAALLPPLAPPLEAVADHLDGVLGDLPGVLRHGDLWLGNLVVADRVVAVDWDAAHPAGVPGADLFGLVASGWRRRHRADAAAVLAARLWAHPLVGRLWEPSAAAYGVRFDGRVAEAVALAWWASHVAGTLRRLPQRAADRGWVDRNVVSVLAAR